MVRIIGGPLTLTLVSLAFVPATMIINDVNIHPSVVSPYLASAPFRDAHVTNEPPATDHTVDLRTCNCAPS